VAERRDLEAAARRWLARHVRREATDALSLDARAWDGAASALAGEVLARTVATVGGRARPLGRGRVEAVVRLLRQGRARVTLGGALVGRAGARLVVTPERPTSQGPDRMAGRRPPLAGAPFDASHVVTDVEILIC
jgi:hypothetical protein